MPPVSHALFIPLNPPKRMHCPLDPSPVKKQHRHTLSPTYVYQKLNDGNKTAINIEKQYFSHFVFGQLAVAQSAGLPSCRYDPTSTHSQLGFEYFFKFHTSDAYFLYLLFNVYISLYVYIIF